MKEVDNVLRILKETKIAFERNDSYQLKRLSNQTTNTASLTQDPDNIAFAKKFILDGFQKGGLIAGDGWKQVTSFSDSFSVDPGTPRVEVTIE